MEESSRSIQKIKNYQEFNSPNSGIAMLIIDKFIACVLLNNRKINLQKIIAEKHLTNKVDGFSDRYEFDNNIFLVRNDSVYEKDVTTNHKFDIYYQNLKFGVIYLSPRNSYEYYFKIDNEIFTSKRYSIKYLCGIFLTIFDEDATISSIFNLDIACDTIAPNFLQNLAAVVDSSQNIHFYKGLKTNQEKRVIVEDELHSNSPVGRTMNDFPYKFKKPNLVANNINGSIYLGSLRSDKFFRVYCKDLKLSGYQEIYLNEKFGEDRNPVTRIELSLKKKAVKKIDINKLDDYNYIKELFVTEANDYLAYFDVRDGRYYDDKRNLKWNTQVDLMNFITIMDNHHEFQDDDFSRITQKKGTKKRKLTSIEKGKLTNVLKKYLNQPNVSNLDKILGYLKSNPIIDLNNSFKSKKAGFNFVKSHIQENLKNRGFDLNKLNELLVNLEERMMPSLKGKVKNLNSKESYKTIDNEIFGIKINVKKKRYFFK